MKNLTDSDNNSFEHAKENARPDCPECNGTGMYQYSTRGTPHFTVCKLCCKHDRGWWRLDDFYGEDNGKWCCRAGCGKMLTDEKHNDIPLLEEIYSGSRFG